MKRKPVQYTESHKLSPNVFLVFYVYVTLIFIVANIVPVSATGYFIFFLLGVTALFLLFIRASYRIMVSENILSISIKFFTRIVLQRLDIKEVESVEELKINDVAPSFKIKKTPGSISYLVKIPQAVKVSMSNKKNYIVSTTNPDHLIKVVKSIKN